MTNPTRAQRSFLKHFIQSPTGPTPNDWPAPAVLRRWLRHKGFRNALASIQSAHTLRADFAISQAAASAATLLADLLTTPADDPDYQIPFEHFRPLLSILQHLHRRNPNPPNSPPLVAGPPLESQTDSLPPKPTDSSVELQPPTTLSQSRPLLLHRS